MFWKLDEHSELLHLDQTLLFYCVSRLQLLLLLLLKGKQITAQANELCFHWIAEPHVAPVNRFLLGKIESATWCLRASVCLPAGAGERAARQRQHRPIAV